MAAVAIQSENSFKVCNQKPCTCDAAKYGRIDTGGGGLQGRQNAESGSNLEVSNEKGGTSAKLTEWEIKTKLEGHNKGRTYLLRSATDHERSASLQAVRGAMIKEKERVMRLNNPTKLSRIFTRLYKFVHCNPTQITVACLICANFIVNIAMVEVMPEPGSWEERMFDTMDYTFTGFFIVEIALRMITEHRHFFFQVHNVFDFLVVALSVVSWAFESVRSVSILRMLRVFRVVRLVRRFTAWRTIVNTLSASMVPLANCLFLLFMVSALYSVLAVTFFGSHNASLFGNFSRSLFTMCAPTRIFLTEAMLPLRKAQRDAHSCLASGSRSPQETGGSRTSCARSCIMERRTEGR
jgi:hypothetical protein